MSEARDSSLLLPAIEARRDELERLAESDLPIAQDAERTLELLRGQEEEQ